MKKQVPEKKAKVDLEEQVRRIRELALNEHFQKIRGRCGGFNDSFINILYYFFRYVDKKPMAPSRYTDELKDFCASLPIVFGKLAQMDRDGYDVAFREVESALCQSDYQMLGEPEKDEKTVPYTLVIFEANATLVYMTSLADKFQPHGDQKVNTSFAPSELRNRFSLKDFFEANGFYHFDNSNGIISMDKYSSILWKLSAPKLEKLQLFGRKKYANFGKFHYAQTLQYEKANERKRAAEWETGLAYLFQAEQKNVLRAFSRIEQSNIATWQFHLPKRMNDHSSIGLYPEAEHTYWKDLGGAIVSVGVNRGYGAIIRPGEAYYHFDEKFKNHRNNRILLTND